MQWQRKIDDNPGALHCLVHTVKDNKTFFMKDEIRGAGEAHCIQKQIGWPNTTTFKCIIDLKMLQN
eukprot:3849656-Ditylum_brightwellii.AAC.1